MNNKDKITLAAVGIVLAAGAVLASTGVLSFGEKPDVLLKKMADAKMAVTSSHFDVSINAELQGTTDVAATAFTLHATGVSAKQGTEQNADLTLDVAATEAGSAEKFELSADARLLDRIMYLKPTKVPAIPFIPTASLVNKWFSIDPVALSKEFGTSAQATELESALGASAKMPAEFYQKTYALVIQEKLVSSIMAKGSEVVSDVAADKYELKIDLKKLPSFMEKYTDLYNVYAPGADLKQLPHKTFTEEEKKVFDSLEMSPIAVWVGKADSLPYKMSFAVTIHPTESTTTLTAPSIATAGTISFTALMSDYNKPVTIEKPGAATPIQDFIKGLMGPQMMGY